MTPRVVITGIGAVTPIGIGARAFWDGLTQGVCGIREIARFDVSAFKSRKAAEVRTLDGVKFPGREKQWNGSRSVTFAVAAAALALEDAGLQLNDSELPDAGVVFGATLACLNLMARFDQQSLRQGPRTCDPGMFPDTGFSAPACRISILLGIRGFNATLSNGETSGIDAINYGVKFIRSGRAKIVLAGGVEELCFENFLGCYRRGLLSGSHDGDAETCSPMDRSRNGFVLGEGSVVLVLEEYEHARARGVPVLAEFLGCGTSFDPRSSSDSVVRGRGACTAMELALRDSAIQPTDVDFIACNANSSFHGDVSEARAIARVFGKQSKIPITALKSMLGEGYSTAGTMLAAATALALCHGVIPPTINCPDPDRHCLPEWLVRTPRCGNPHIAMVNSFGCNGNHASLVLGVLNGGNQ